jgi:hypothetical protein
MSELKPKSELGPEDENEVAMAIIEGWKQELPEEMSDWIFANDGETTPREEVFKYYDTRIKEMTDNKKEKEHWEKLVFEKGSTNNFHFQFLGWIQKQVLSGKIGEAMDGLKPFYINSRYNNAWNRMCETMPEEVRKAINFELAQDKGSIKMTDEEKESFRNLAIYLNKNEGVILTLLCQ